MKFRHIFLLMFMCLSVGVYAQRFGRSHRPSPPKIKKEFINAFETGTLNGSDVYKLPYRYAYLNQEKDGEPVVVLYLHGASARGDDNVSQLGASVVTKLYNYLKESGNKYILVLPQCPNGTKWNMKGKNGNDMSKSILAVSDSVEHKFNISNPRRYIVGYSLGGGGVLRMLSDYPTLFSGALSASPPLDEKIVPDSIASTPIIMTAGEYDHTTPTNLNPIANQIREAGGDVVVISLKGKDHRQSGSAAFTKETLNLLFNKQ